MLPINNFVNTIKKVLLLSATVTLLSITNILAQDIDYEIPIAIGTIENITWSYNSDGMLIIDGNGVMPDFKEGDTPWYSFRHFIKSILIQSGVTTIGDWAFANFSGLNSIIIGNSVTSIGCEAFYGCGRVISVTIPNSVKSIKESAFYGCSDLEYIFIGSSVSYIGNKAFHWCCSLNSFQVDNENMAYSSENGVLFNKVKTKLIQYPEGKTDSDYSIPNSVYSIGRRAFYRCSALINITIGNSVVYISDMAFYGCNTLKSVTIGNNVVTIGNEVFYNCYNLTEIINLADSPQTINNTVFHGVNKNTCILRVPSTSISTYLTTNVWKDFLNIVGN